MSGHSKWSSIKHQKGVTDARRGQLFTKLARELSVAARQGGAEPEMNVRLRLAIQKARDSNMPLDNIERAVKRGAGVGDGNQSAMEEVVYEGYGPGGAAILLEALTDNATRTVSEVRNVLSRAGGNLGERGCVAWNFESTGVITVETSQEEAEDLALLAIDAGAEDFDLDEAQLEVRTNPGAFEQVRKALEEKGATLARAELSMMPKATVQLEAKQAAQTLRLLDRLEELDDIQHVYTNADFPEESLEEYRKAG
ncbi:MAG: YebC/PmpR family DNA-binding transcriptional regulator [Dehalococcoidia bacterium]